MSYSYSEDFIEQVRISNDILSIVEDYTKLEKSGDSYKGLCPFHDEQTPSFNVSPDEQLYYCFGCGVGGDVFNFVMEIEGLNFVETVEFLAQRVNLDLPTKDSISNQQEYSEKKQLFEIHNLAAKFYSYLLQESKLGEQCYKYLSERGFDDKVIDKFQLGFAPDRWQGLYKFLKNKGYSDQILAKSGLVIARKKSKGYYDRFRNRLMFTICNLQDQVIGFGGRVISDNSQPKYLNSPETIVFNKSKNLYGLNWSKRAIRRSDEAIIMEGYTDVITAHQFGIKNVVASLGTSLTSQQAKLLRRYADRIYIAYDSDSAGEKATLRGLKILKQEGLEVKVIELPVEQDPDDFIKKYGKEKFLKLKQESTSLIKFRINSILMNKNLSLIDDKVAAVKDIIPILGGIKNEIEKHEYLKFISDKLNINSDTINQQLEKYNMQAEKDRKENNRNNNNKFNLKEEMIDSNLNGYINAVNELLKIIINNPEVVKRLEEELNPKDFIQKEEYKIVMTTIFEVYNQEKKLSINHLLKQIEDKQAQDLLLKLSMVKGNSLEYTDKMISDYIKKIKEYQTVMKKERLYSQIQKAEQEQNYDKVSKLLKEYNDLVGKEGY